MIDLTWNDPNVFSVRNVFLFSYRLFYQYYVSMNNEHIYQCYVSINHVNSINNVHIVYFRVP